MPSPIEVEVNDEENQNSSEARSDETGSSAEGEAAANSDSASGSGWEYRTHGQKYDWRAFYRDNKCFPFLRWLSSGAGVARQTDSEIYKNMADMAKLLMLLRLYYNIHGMPEKGGPEDQVHVLKEVCKDLYLGGAPIWALESVLERAAEGLTGERGYEILLLPRKAFIYTPRSENTIMFRIIRGFDVSRLTAMEAVLVRIASYASNTRGVSSLETRLPKPAEVRQAFRQESLNSSRSMSGVDNTSTMAKKILSLASHSEGLFFFINSMDRPDTSVDGDNDGDDSNETTEDEGEREEIARTRTESDRFWKVENNIRELFSRLATVDALRMMDRIDDERKTLYPFYVICACRFLSSAGACALWFGGSWFDTIVAGLCGSLVGVAATFRFLTKEERVIFETIASFMVGFIAGIVSITWPDTACFGAIGLAGVLDILQGFRIVYSVIELMSKHTLSGAADFLEGVLYTMLISSFLRLGQLSAERAFGRPLTDTYLECKAELNVLWYFLIVPVASLGWSVVFNPEHRDLPSMTLCGVLAYTVNWACSKSDISSSFALYFSAVVVTLSSGLASRFSGRQAMGNTMSGLYVLLPGAYLVNHLYLEISFDFLGSIILNSAVIGLGAWTGTILCSPTVLGSTVGLIRKQTNPGSLLRSSGTPSRSQVGAMVFF